MKAIYVEGHHSLADGVNAAHRRVTAVMSSPVRCVTVATPPGDALRTMVRTGLRHLAVPDESGQFIGIVTGSDLIAQLAR